MFLFLFLFFNYRGPYKQHFFSIFSIFVVYRGAPLLKFSNFSKKKRVHRTTSTFTVSELKNFKILNFFWESGVPSGSLTQQETKLSSRRSSNGGPNFIYLFFQFFSDFWVRIFIGFHTVFTRILKDSKIFFFHFYIFSTEFCTEFNGANFDLVFQKI